VCQRNKGETVKSSGTLQPLPIPPAIWKDISMDFITGLPKLGNKSVTLVVVDHLPSMIIFVPFNNHLQHPRWIKSSWIRSSSFMACHTLLFMIATQLSQEIFGKNYSRYKAYNCISSHLIIPRLLAKWKLSTSVWKHI
jgi:hypothetical protein